MLDVSADQRFAKLLVERGKLRDADMTRALRVQEGQASRERLSRLIVRLGLISERDAADTLSEILERQVARLADEQRRQLGQQVHDSLGQQLTAIGLLVGTLRNRLGTGDSVADVTSNLERCVD
ncbi:MAG: histidine kinase, partial [Vicinamibacterales bacterium]